jgi:hypothetical protein
VLRLHGENFEIPGGIHTPDVTWKKNLRNSMNVKSTKINWKNIAAKLQLLQTEPHFLKLDKARQGEKINSKKGCPYTLNPLKIEDLIKEVIRPALELAPEHMHLLDNTTWTCNCASLSIIDEYIYKWCPSLVLKHAMEGIGMMISNGSFL